MKKSLWRSAVCLLLISACVLSASAVPDTGGKSALLMEKTTGTILYEKNAHQRLAPASVTKVMTMLLIMEAIDSGRISYDDMVTASESAAAKGGSQIYLKVGETMSVRDMLKSIAVSSANDCACAMAEFISGSEEAFVEAMNARAKELNMADTHFVNCTGLDDGGNASEHRTSAHDIAIMSRELIAGHPDIRNFTTIWMDTVRNGSFGLSNTNKLIRFYPGATGLKTGFTSGAGYCLSATAERDGMELIAVSMGCESSKVRAAACKSMLDYGFANYALVTASAEDMTVELKMGKKETVAVKPASLSPVLVDKGKKNTVTVDYSLPDYADAPVRAGQKLGVLTVCSGDEVLSQVDLLACETVERLNFGDVFVKLLRSVCGCR